MFNKKLIACGLVSVMAMSAMPTQIFAQGAHHNTPMIATNLEAPLTTQAALEVVFENIQSIERQETLLSLTKDGEIEESFDISYKWDENWFFQDNTVFNQELARTASIFAALSYYSSQVDLAVNEATASTGAYAFASETGEITDVAGIQDVLSSHDLEDVKEYNLRNYADDNHVAQFNVAHKSISNGTEDKELVVISIRGTRGEMEWLSNFAMGQESKFDATPEWEDRQNHMGFDITANRIVDLVEDYMAEHNVQGKEVTFFITGHSRGGALANLIGKKFEDKNCDTYTYAFATPNNSVNPDAKNQYPSIFNILNEDDIVPMIPAKGWGFTKYGQTVNVDMTDDLQAAFNEIVGKEYTTASSFTLKCTVAALGNVFSSRDEAYVCGEDLDEYKVTKTFDSEEERAEALAAIPEACMEFATVELHESGGILSKKKYKYTMYQSPMYFVTAAGLNLAGSMSSVEFLKFDVAEAYKLAKVKLMAAGIGGLSHPHYMESYIVIADKGEF